MPLQAMLGAAQLLVRVVRSACFCVHATSAQEDFVPHQPVMQVRGKAVFAATRQRQRKRPQLAGRLTFRLFAQVAGDDPDLVKLAHLHRNTGKGLQQPAASVTDNALYLNAFFSQRRDRLRVERIGFPLNCHDHQGALAASVVEDHDAPFPPEVGSIHNEVNCRLRDHAGRFHDCFGKMAADSFEAASVLRGKLCGALLAFAVALPKGVGIKALAPYELALTGAAMVLLLPVVTMPIFLDLFGAAEKAFFVFKGFDLA